MALHLSDLDELLQLVRNPYSRNYLEEAVKAYRIGAYRASIISTWIAVCVDITEKIRELSLGNDGSAKNIENQLNRIMPTDVTGMLDFERKILDYACDDLELISTIEKRHLEHLKDDRNICAHPTFAADGSQFNPSPELARAYIVQAANYLLTQPPVRGKVIIERLFNLINEYSFPDDDEGAYVILSSDQYLGRVRESSVRNLVLVILKRLFRDDTTIKLEMIDKLCSALGAINRIYPVIYSEVLNNKLTNMLAETDDRLLKRLFGLLFRRPEAWKHTEKAIKIRLEGAVKAMDANDLIKYRVIQVSSILPYINDVLQVQLDKLSSIELTKLIKAVPSKMFTAKVIEIFTRSRSYDSAHSNGTNYLLPHAEFFTSEDLKKLFECIYSNQPGTYNQVLGAGGIDEVFCLMYEKTKKNIFLHSQMWKEFVIKVSEDGYNYERLTKLLTEDGLLESKQDIAEIQKSEEL